MDLSNLMGMFGDVQAKMDEAKANLDAIIINQTANGISITLTASKKIQDISIDQELLTDKDELEDMLMIAFNNAIESAEASAETEMQKVSEGLLPPGML